MIDLKAPAITKETSWVVPQSVIAAMRPGVKAGDLFRLCAAEFEKAGLDFQMPHVGHSIGVVMQENPMLQPFDETPLGRA